MVRSVWWLLPLALLAGCTSTDVAEPEPTHSAGPSESVPSPTGSPDGCAVAGVAVGKPADPEQTFTYAVRLQKEEGSSTSTQLAAAPFTPTLIWQTSPAPQDAQVMAAIEELDDAPTLETRDGTDAVNTFLSDASLSAPVDIVGYSSIVTVQHAVRVSCEGGGQALGTLTSWTDPETGVVSCDDGPARTDPPSPARLAYVQFCRDA